jgi:hypothetical protein
MDTDVIEGLEMIKNKSRGVAVYIHYFVENVLLPHPDDSFSSTESVIRTALEKLKYFFLAVSDSYALVIENAK